MFELINHCDTDLVTDVISSVIGDGQLGMVTLWGVGGPKEAFAGGQMGQRKFCRNSEGMGLRLEPERLALGLANEDDRNIGGKVKAIC